MTAPWTPPRRDGQPTHLQLTSRRLQVLDGICRGWPNWRIARELGVAEDTVKTHVRHLMRLTGSESRAALVAAVYSGAVRVLQPPPPAWERQAPR